MPLPLIIGIGAAIAGAAGVGSGIRGGMKMKEANETMKLADSRHKKNISRFEKQSKKTSEQMDKVGQEELRILNSFEAFTQVFEKIHNKPQFKTFDKAGVVLPQYNAEELKKVSASAALGGGSIAAGGGGMALGSAILGGATLGVGLLVGGIIFNITGSSLSNKADEAWSQMKKAEGEIDKICLYLDNLFNYAEKFYSTLTKVNRLYIEHFEKLRTIVEVDGKTNWNMFTSEEQVMTQNTALLVGVLFNMCKVKLVLVAENETDSNKVNSVAINKSIEDANKVLLNMN